MPNYKLPLIAFFLTFLFVFSGCSNRTQQTIEELDKFYGKCDNPHRNIQGREYDICKAKERAAGGEEFDLSTGIVEKIIGSMPSRGAVVMSGANSSLWQASLQTLGDFSIKIADSNGGYIETDWINGFNEQNKDQRCLVKVFVTSVELISNGVQTKLNCQSLENGNWKNTSEDYSNAEKQLTLKILSLASEISQTQVK